MQKRAKKEIIWLSAVIGALIIQVVFMMFSINSIQGNGRVVNYAGIVRGATQRLVKNELYGKADDNLIERLDDILLGLQTGEGTQNLTVLDDFNYQTKLKALAAEWENVKENIYEARKDPDKKADLYELSETYFAMADETVSAAEAYSDGIAKKMNKLEISIAANIVVIVLMLLVGIASEIKKNRNLNRIAYIDPQTGLPNKRSCDEWMKDISIIEENTNVCCLMFDLNNLKVTNDTLGHEAGDALITTFASLLRRNMPKDMFVGRLGGDEFIGIQKDADKADVMRRVKQMRDETSGNNVNETKSSLRISFAYGSAFSQEHHQEGITIRALMNEADKNMYLDKERSKREAHERDLSDNS